MSGYFTKTASIISSTTSSDTAHTWDPRTTVQEGNTEIQVLTWNIAAPNNNPFEFWNMHKDKDYDDLMMGVQRYIDDPHRPTESISQIFTQATYDEL